MYLIQRRQWGMAEVVCGCRTTPMRLHCWPCFYVDVAATDDAYERWRLPWCWQRWWWCYDEDCGERWNMFQPRFMFIHCERFFFQRTGNRWLHMCIPILHHIPHYSLFILESSSAANKHDVSIKNHESSTSVMLNHCVWPSPITNQLYSIAII